MIYNSKKVKQLKLVTGEEIMCEIIEEDEQDIIIRNALTIHFETMDDGGRMWLFKYFMCCQDEPERFLLVKMDKIVAIANPIDELYEQYYGAITSMMDNPSTDEVWDEEEEGVTKDNDQGKVVKFPTIH